ncbi:EVE domain-containing protein [Stutzerimonas kirkiae]|uniref:EVE domain-containing protein n=1 Tax=Stutzerimonas kirkiae TaxID=2211392 RepID=UPI0010385DC6|nr:EVE domain-containing protein [Stutzerimonas kirkiae]TBV11880.1 EVE domain-containing protein [Stutzerimonas kirkiae]
MHYWLMKSEPDELSIETLSEHGRARWDGVRNYQARNYLRSMEQGDLFLFYHSSCALPGVAGIARIATSAYPDPAAIDPHSPYHDSKATALANPWSAVDVEFVERFPQVVPLARLKEESALGEMPLLKKGNRLSVMPVSAGQWQRIIELATGRSGC